MVPGALISSSNWGSPEGLGRRGEVVGR